MHFVFGLITTAFAKPVCPSALGAEKRGRVDGERSDIGGKWRQMESGKASVNRNGKEYICFDAALCDKSEKERLWCSFFDSVHAYVCCSLEPSALLRQSKRSASKMPFLSPQISDCSCFGFLPVLVIGSKTPIGVTEHSKEVT
jgi:hypothetical protein